MDCSMVINGESTPPFDVARGFRQGDPMSPFLFSIVMEHLSRSLKTLKEEKQFKYHPKCSKLNVTHMCFADDLLMFAKGANELIRKSLVAWSRMCMPKATEGLNLTNLKLWNKAAITKICWDLKTKKDTLWIKCNREYYIKAQPLESMAIPQQASWMVRKILKALEELCHVQPDHLKSKSMIISIYLRMVWDLSKVAWKNIICGNEARPKAIFITWLQQQDRLLTATRLENWRIQVDTTFVMCKVGAESRNHLFVECAIGRQVWDKLMKRLQITWVAMSS
ncbi:uncharacterized protein [Nicotiana tomentosiformis]|uniref:uncharacterized protein n=1 Tax=Nicotiana tomentosiformis TaxID=4098 RepID=UPI00388CE7DA